MNIQRWTAVNIQYAERDKTHWGEEDWRREEDREGMKMTRNGGVTKKTSFIKIKKENYTYQIFTPWIIDSKNSSSSVVCLDAILSLLLWMKANWIIDNWCSVRQWEKQNDTVRKVFCKHWGQRVWNFKRGWKSDISPWRSRCVHQIHIQVLTGGLSRVYISHEHWLQACTCVLCCLSWVSH